MSGTATPPSELKVGHWQHKAAGTVSALHHRSPMQGIRFLVPRLHPGQKLWSQIEIQINYIEKETCTCPSEIPRPCSPPWCHFKNSCCSTPLCPHRQLWPAQARLHRNSADRRGGKNTHILIPTLCTSQVTISFKLHTTQKFKRRFTAGSVWNSNFSWTITLAAF